MEFKLNATIVLVLSICLVHIVVAKPRTTTNEQRDEVIPLDQTAILLEKTTAPSDITVKKSSVPETKIPGRVTCQFDEPTEEFACQEHCIPKGYTYGLCVSYTCSCI